MVMSVLRLQGFFFKSSKLSYPMVSKYVMLSMLWLFYPVDQWSSPPFEQMATGDSIVRDIEKRWKKKLNKTELKNLAGLNNAYERLRYNLFLNSSWSLRKSVDCDLKD